MDAPPRPRPHQAQTCGPGALACPGRGFLSPVPSEPGWTCPSAIAALGCGPAAFPLPHPAMWHCPQAGDKQPLY